MGLTMSQRKAITAQTVERYRRATRRQKAALLDEFVRMHGCTRHHAGWVLRMWGKTVFERRDGQLVAVVVGQRRPRRRSARHYDERVATAVRRVWHLFGFLCGKRLVAVLRTQLPVLLTGLTLPGYRLQAPAQPLTRIRSDPDESVCESICL